MLACIPTGNESRCAIACSRNLSTSYAAQGISRSVLVVSPLNRSWWVELLTMKQTGSHLTNA